MYVAVNHRISPIHEVWSCIKSRPINRCCLIFESWAAELNDQVWTNSGSWWVLQVTFVWTWCMAHVLVGVEGTVVPCNGIRNGEAWKEEHPPDFHGPGVLSSGEDSSWMHLASIWDKKQGNTCAATWLSLLVTWPVTCAIRITSVCHRHPEWWWRPCVWQIVTLHLHGCCLKLDLRS